MYSQKLTITMKDMERYKLIQDTLNKKLTAKEASLLLRLSYRHFLRLKGKVSSGGLEALLRPSRKALNKIPKKDITEILDLRKNIYYDLNVSHFMDKLHELHNFPYSYESIRQILITSNDHTPKKRKKVHRQRRRMPKAGLLVQMDSSQHLWLPKIPEKWWLIATIDDATNEVAYAQLFPQDTVFTNMHILRHLIELKGVFRALYVDKASHFKTTRHGGLHYNVSDEQEDTQIERALGELGIDLIPANSPQAKGRIEVTFRLFQDRFIKEMRLAGIENYPQANKFLLENFLPWYNSRFTHKAESAYTPVMKDKDLDHIFCNKKVRTVSNDNIVQIHGQTIQILPSSMKRTFARLKVDVCTLEDNRLFVLYKNTVIAESKLSKNNKISKKEREIEKLLSTREYVPVKSKRRRKPIYKPGGNHPWRSFKRKNNKYAQTLNVTS